jgi:DEAD/DEAH box helicase domain-containing protein
VQSPKCGNGNRPLDKAGAIRWLGLLLEGVGLEAWRAAGARPDRPPPPTLAELFAEIRHSPPAGLPRLALLDVAPVSGAASFPLKGPEDSAPAPTPPPPPASHKGSDPSPFYGPFVSSSLPEESFSPSSTPLPASGADCVRAGTVLFDVETIRSAAEVGGWNRAHRMGIAVAVALHLEEGRFETYLEPDVPRLVAALKRAALVIGFNSKRFDYAVLSGYTGEDYGRTLPSLDLLEVLYRQLGFRVGLGHLALETLGRGKSADGLQSLEWVKQGRLDLVEAYCRQDVEVLRDVYLFGRREGYVLISNKQAGRVRVPVDW